MSDSSHVWFITGCSSGFGHALAEAALLAGDLVIATARNRADLEMLEHVGAGRCQIMALDVTQPEQVKAVIREAQAVWGRLDVVVNNAGYGLIGAIEECSEEQVRRNFETNFFGPLHVIQAVAPILREQKRGHIINISAAAAIANYPGFGIYGAAKAALEAMSESLRLELAAYGVKITLVQPGPFRTRFIGKGMERTTLSEAYAGSAGKFATYLEKVDGKQPGDPERAATLIVKMVHAGQAPFRLPLGKYAVKKVQDTAAARMRELDTWQALAEDADGA